MEQVTPKAREALQHWADAITMNVLDHVKERPGGDPINVSVNELTPILRNAVFESLVSAYWLLSGDDLQRLYAVKNVHEWLAKTPDDWGPPQTACAEELDTIRREDLVELPHSFSEKSIRRMAEFMDSSRYVFSDAAVSQSD